MTEQTPLTSPTTGRPPLRRSTQDRVIGGVCAGVARWLEVDVVVVRLVVALFAVFGGGGIVAYLLAWLLIPADGADRSEAERLADTFRGRRS